MKDSDTISSPRSISKTYLLLAGTALALGWILLPFYGAILWAVIIALLFAPLYRWLLPLVGQRRTWAALITMSIAIVIVILPFFGSCCGFSFPAGCMVRFPGY